MSEPITSFRVTYARRPVGRLALVTLDNDADHTKPTLLGEKALRSLTRALDEIEEQDDLAGLLVTGKPFVFAAGADLKQFKGLDRDRALEAARAGHEVFARLQALPFPTVAAINGVCLGGGLELALHCDYRTLSTGARAIAFPEVFLSIFPAWGGTQLAPRLVGARMAIATIVLDAIDNNRMMRPEQALERGFADRLYPAAGFLDDSVAFLQRIVAREEQVVRDVDPADGLDEALAEARAAVEARTHGATPAPEIALELIEHAARGGDLEEGRRMEQERLADLIPSRQAQASVYSFELVRQRAKRQPGRPDAPPRDIRKVAVLGAGLMGAQIGSLHLQRLEVPLVVTDVDQDVLERAREHIEAELAKRVERGRMEQGKARFLAGLVTYTTELEALDGADWVIEAVSERMDLKQAVLAEAEAHLEPGAVMATNTSSLSIAEMSAKMAHPQRLVGFHLFNPIKVMPLVEVIGPEAATDEALATAFELAKRLGKTAVGCADAPAFVVNRLMLRFNLAASSAIRNGNDFRDIDDAVKQLGVPMGPFELFGLVGLEVALHATTSLAEAFPDRFEVDDNLRALGASGLPGVYDWSADGEVFPQILEAVTVDDDATALSQQEIRDRAIEAAADEARRMLDDGVVADARDIDTAMLLGAGWPFFNGGICMYLDQTGVSERMFSRPLVTAEDAALG